MPLTFPIEAINVVSEIGATQTVASDRPVRSDDLELLGVEKPYLEASGFTGEVGETTLLPNGTNLVIAVGLGDSELTVSEVRRASASLWKAATKVESLSSTVAMVAAQTLGAEKALQAVIEGMLLASYRFDEHKGKTEDSTILENVVIVAPDGVDASKALARGLSVAKGIALARDLVNHPGGSMTAIGMAREAEKVASETGLEIETWDRQRLQEEKCGGILGVNAGSTEEPRLIRMTYRPPGESRATIHLVGKGITFDTGGLNLKSFEGMETMKIDMGGAAAVIGAMSALSSLVPDVTVVGTCCCTDNQPGPNATKPGDVLRIRNGKTVEVLNTDAEGRLVLADGLSISAEETPDLIVDLATLTGACMVALGNEYAGLMGNDAGAVARVESASSAANEKMWHLPLPKEYRKQLDSPIADLRNIGTGRLGGALTAGLFLKEFAGDIPWVHLDIAGPVTTEETTGESSKGATGFGVRTLLELVVSW